MSELTRRYAEAFLEAGGREDELRHAGELLAENPVLWQALLNPTISARAKQRVLHRVPGLSESKTLAGFFCLIAEKGRMSLLEQITRDVHLLNLKKHNGAECIMTCVREPSAQQLEALAKKLCKLHHLDKVELNVKTDASLLGGFTLELCGVTYDKSVRGALNELSRNIRER